MVKIYVVIKKEDDPYMCTAEKLVRKGMAIKLTTLASIPNCAIVLNPLAHTYIKNVDRSYVEKCGLVAIDVSWKSGIGILKNIRKGIQRILPILIASNPINYGKPFKLSTAEAIAAALYITGYIEHAFSILQHFKWGQYFLELNKSRLEKYSRIESDEELEKIQMELLGIDEFMSKNSKLIDLLHKIVLQNYHHNSLNTHTIRINEH